MATPSEALIRCKTCGVYGEPHQQHKLHCLPCGRARCVDYTRRHREKLKAFPRVVVCKGCGQEFDASRAGRTWRCQPCTNAYQVERAALNRERSAQHSRNYRARQGDAYRVKMVQRRNDELAAMTTEERVAFRRKEADKASRLNAKLREEVFARYGWRCACCGELEPLFLTIDHVNNDGAEMRARGDHSRGGTQFYQWLRKNGFPPEFQTLCMNCNLGKHRNGGTCPHQGTCNDYPGRE